MKGYWLQDFANKREHSSADVGCGQRARSKRIYLVGLAALLWSGLVVWRLLSLQIFERERWQEWASRQHFSDVLIASERGPIVDRNGKLLAISIPAQSVYVRPAMLEDRKSAAAILSKDLQMPLELVERKLNDKKSFVWLERQLPRSVGESVTAHKISGIGAIDEAKRVYPFNEAASQLIGKIGIDGNGLSGIERVYEKELKGNAIKTRASKDAFGKLIHSENTTLEPPRGKALQLTIDTSLQIIVDEEVDRARDENKAKNAMAVLVDSESGEILALSQSPRINLNSKESSSDSLRNLVAETVFEPGSVMKPIVAAAALEEGLATPNDMINCEQGRFSYATHVIKDTHPSGVISFFDVVVRSSNIGMTKIGMRLGESRLYGYLRSFGFGENTKLGLPGESSGILRPVSSWAKVDLATHSFGQGVAVTPLQVVRAMAAIANGGRLPQLRIVETGEPSQSVRVISEETAHTVREMLYGVVEEEHGTGGKASIPGVRVGGKTGTAQKARADGRGYETGAYLASFVGFVDGSKLGVRKNLSLVVSVDEPQGLSIYGGAVAAPAFKRIMERVMRVLLTKDESPISRTGSARYVEARSAPLVGDAYSVSARTVVDRL